MKLKFFPIAPFPSSARLVVGVSGGSDSVALFSFLKESLPHFERRLVIAHVNYGLRGKDSRKDEDFVRNLSREWGVRCRVLRVKNKNITGRSIQDWAREIRYGYFGSLVKREKSWGVAIAHHLEDQAETVLDRLLRGAGPRGLSGLRSIQELSIGPLYRSPLKIWRPLLSFSKIELQEYLLVRKITWREDASNEKTLYRRNQIRHQIIPFLSKWNKGLVGKLAQTGEILSSEDAWLDRWIGEMILKLEEKRTTRRYALSQKKFQALDIAIQRRIIRRGAEILEPRARGLSFERLEEALEVWSLKRQGPRDMGFGLSVGITDGELFIRKSGPISHLPSRFF